MFERHEVFELILGLVETSSWDIFPEVARKHPSDIPPEDFELHVTIGTALQDVIETYDYVQSPAFQRQVSGKSENFVAMKVKFESEPVKRREHEERLILALSELPFSESAFDLLAETRHSRLRDIQNAIAALSSPAAN